MTTPSSGPISATDINAELSDWNLNKVSDRAATALVSLNDAEVRRLALSSTTAISFSDLRGVPKPVTSLSAVTLGATNILFNIAYGAGMYVAVGTGTILVSPSGLSGTWVARTAPTTAVIGAVAYAKNLGVWVITSDDNKLFTSTDTITWTLRTTPFSVINIRQIATNGSSFCIVNNGAGSTLVAYSTDGITFTALAAFGSLTSSDPHWNGTLGKYIIGAEDRGIRSVTPGTWVVASIQGFINQADNLGYGGWLSNGTDDYSILHGYTDIAGKIQLVSSSTGLSTGLVSTTVGGVAVTAGINRVGRGVQGKELWFLGTDKIHRLNNALGAMQNFSAVGSWRATASDGYRVVIVGAIGTAGAILISNH